MYNICALCNVICLHLNIHRSFGDITTYSEEPSYRGHLIQDLLVQLDDCGLHFYGAFIVFLSKWLARCAKLTPTFLPPQGTQVDN